ncbi:MAG: hypothetical protein LBC51_08220 [Treponema sp.]|nr:hypothetical protein [Treponema sp.]
MNPRTEHKSSYRPRQEGASARIHLEAASGTSQCPSNSRSNGRIDPIDLSWIDPIDLGRIDSIDLS